GLERPNIEIAILGELVERDQPLTIGFLGLPHGSVVVTRLVMHIQLLPDRINFLTLEGALGILNVPFADLAVDEERRIGVALTIISGMQWPKPQFRLCNYAIARLDLVVEKFVELANIEHRHSR